MLTCRQISKKKKSNLHWPSKRAKSLKSKVTYNLCSLYCYFI